MLQHRSGIPNFVDHPTYWSNPPKTKEETLAYDLDLPADFEPGEDYGYSNANYMLISDLIDKEVSYSHQQFIKEEILDPLGLNNTYGSIHDVDLDNLMSGYYAGIEEDLKTEETGLMIATAEDVGKFIRALNDGSVFRSGEQEVYTSIYEYEHTGLIVGYQSIAKYHKDLDAVVVQFNNTTNFEGYEWSIAEITYSRILKILRRRED